MTAIALQPGDHLLIATYNRGKLVELRALLRPHECRLHSVNSMILEPVEETGQTFEDNALLKARSAAAATGMAAIADDCGLCIAALEGAPGLETARWASQLGGWDEAMAEIHRRLSEIPQPHVAEFYCALALATPDGRSLCVAGRAPGTVVWPPRGILGFGYDPIFQPDGHQQTFGEMEAATRDRVNHRAIAFSRLAQQVFQPVRR